jgi:hypothetical protein
MFEGRTEPHPWVVRSTQVFRRDRPGHWLRLPPARRSANSEALSHRDACSTGRRCGGSLTRAGAHESHNKHMQRTRQKRHAPCRARVAPLLPCR